MTAIYSTKLASGSQAAGVEDTVFTAPAGYTTVVRCVSLMPGTSGGGTALLGISGGGFLAGGPNGTVNQVEVTNGRWVLSAGDELLLITATSNFYYLVSGYLLLA